MGNSQKSPIQAKRIQSIIEYLTFEVFSYSMRGFYEEHKFLFTILLALKIDLRERKIKQEEFEVFIKGMGRDPLERIPSLNRCGNVFAVWLRSILFESYTNKTLEAV